MRFLWSLLAGLALVHGAMAQDSTERAISVSVNNGAIRVDPDNALVTKGHNKVVWVLNAAGYRFAPNGIVIAGDGKEYGNCGPRGNSPTVYVCKKLRHVDQKQYKYDVNLVDGNGRPARVDPYIKNE